MNKIFCTFSQTHELESVVQQIIKIFSPNKLFVLENKTTPEYIITYPFSFRENTIHNTVLVHRKAEYNVLYSLNGLNAIIVKELGYLDLSYQVNWSQYQNMLITFTDNQLIFNKTKLYKILSF